MQQHFRQGKHGVNGRKRADRRRVLLACWAGQEAAKEGKAPPPQPATAAAAPAATQDNHANCAFLPLLACLLPSNSSAYLK